MRIRIASVSPGQVDTDPWLGDHGVAATIGRVNGSNFVIDGGLLKTM